jgi:hypothetical protein
VRENKQEFSTLGVLLISFDVSLNILLTNQDFRLAGLALLVHADLNLRIPFYNAAKLGFAFCLNT